LVHSKAAYIVDDVAAHRAALRSEDPAARRDYVNSLRRRKLATQKVLAEKQKLKATEVAERFGRAKPQALAANAEPRSHSSADADGGAAADLSRVDLASVTPTSSRDLISSQQDSACSVRDVTRGPVCSFLRDAGYYMTPGLRFGARYSVYPGDPLRFHAHFMANQYDWDEPIPLLDIVGGGRLATAVKKAFLIGGEEPDVSVKMYSIEWAAM
jgi:tRNA-splicing endonuclease subunit Sen34